VPVEIQEQIAISPDKQESGPLPGHLVAVVAVAFLVRIGLMVAFRTWAFADARGHYAFGYETGSIAASLARGFGFSSPFGAGLQTGPTAWVAPIFPAMVALIFKLFGVYSPLSAIVTLTINSVFSALTCLPIYAIGRRAFGARSATWGAWIWAVVPFYTRWPITWVWETALAALLLSVLFLMTIRLESPAWQPWLCLGATWGFSALAAPSLLGFLPFSFLYPAWKLRADWKRVSSRLACTGLLFLVVIAPWMARNYAVFHRPVFLRGNYWFEFSLGNFHGAGGAAWSGAHPASNPVYFRRYAEIGEVAFVAERKAVAFRFVKEHKGEFILLTLKRVKDFWDGSELAYEPPDPFSPWMMLTNSALMAGGLWLAFRRGVNLAVVFAGLFVLYPIPYYLTYTNQRYRHPIEPMMVVLTGFLLAEGWQMLRSRFSAFHG
jgi:hypothetical protein